MMQRFHKAAENRYTLALHLIVSLLSQVFFSAFTAQSHICTTIFGALMDVVIEACFRHKEVVKRLLNSVTLVKDDQVKIAHCQFQKCFPLLPHSGCRKSRDRCKYDRSSIAFSEHPCAQTLIEIRTQVIFVSLF